MTPEKPKPMFAKYGDPRCTGAPSKRPNCAHYHYCEGDCYWLDDDEHGTCHNPIACMQAHTAAIARLKGKTKCGSGTGS